MLDNHLSAGEHTALPRPCTYLLEKTLVDPIPPLRIPRLSRPFGPGYLTGTNMTKTQLEACIDDERQIIQDGQASTKAPGDAIVRKRFFRDNFVIFRRRSKRIEFLESVDFSTYVYMQIFNFRDGHVIIFRHYSWVSISPKCLVTDSPD